MGPLSLRLCLCAALCALGLACSGESAPSSPTPGATADAATAALLSTSAAGLVATPAPAATQTPAPSTAPPQATIAPPATPPAAVTNAPAPAPTANPAARPAPVTLPVTLDTKDQTYEPHQIHGNFDDTVIVSLKGSGDRHSFTVPILGLDQVIEKDKTAVVTLVLPLALGGPTAEGTFPFYCRFHGSPTSGMHGFLIFH